MHSRECDSTLCVFGNEGTVQGVCLCSRMVECVFLDPLFWCSFCNCKWIFIWVTDETVVHMVVLEGLFVQVFHVYIRVVCWFNMFVFRSMWCVCVHIVVGIECEYSG